MGMFDNIKCHAPLPGTPPSFVDGPDHLFQTKDLDCELAVYEITDDGRLFQTGKSCYADEMAAEPIAYHGTIEFYDGNLSGYSDGYNFTSKGQDYESVTYLATFDHGRLIGIEETEREQKPALPMRLFHERHAPSDEEIASQKARDSQPLVGRTLWVEKGGLTRERGYAVEVVAESDRQFVVRNLPLDANRGKVVFYGDFEVFERQSLDRIVFDSEANADEAHAGWERVRTERSNRLAAEVKRLHPETVAL